MIRLHELSGLSIQVPNAHAEVLYLHFRRTPLVEVQKFFAGDLIPFLAC
jgi:hypothetical protein